jgi:DNA replication licensing factor MCM7
MPEPRGASAASSSSSSSSSADGNKSRTRWYRKYVDLIQRVLERRAVTIDIDLDDIVLFSDSSLVEDITRNTMRYVQIFSKAIDKLLEEVKVQMQQRRSSSSSSSSAAASSAAAAGLDGISDALVDTEDIADVLLNHRIQLIRQAQEQDASLRDHSAPPPTDAELRAQLRAMFPAALLQRYEVRFKPRQVDEREALSLRQVKAADIGKLVSVRAIVLRASDVKPIVQVAAYTW